MTQEEKELLFRDLCARLQYGVKVCAKFNTANSYTAEITGISTDINYVQIRQNKLHSNTCSSIEDIRLFLRPLSSMKDEERDELLKVMSAVQYNRNEMCAIVDARLAEAKARWYDKNMFDHRGLIPKGLALEATKEMYET